MISRFKLFLEWSRSNVHMGEYRKFIEESFLRLCEEEIEMMKTIIDISMEYQDDGAEFEFLIYVGKREDPNRWLFHVYTFENECVILDSGHIIGLERSLQRCENQEGAPFLVVNGDSMKEGSSQDIYQRIKSLFPDWKFEIEISGFTDDVFSLEIYKM